MLSNFKVRSARWSPSCFTNSLPSGYRRVTMMSFKSDSFRGGKEKWGICRRISWLNGFVIVLSFSRRRSCTSTRRNRKKISSTCSRDLSRRFKTDVREKVTRNVWIRNEKCICKGCIETSSIELCGLEQNNKKIFFLLLFHDWKRKKGNELHL